MLYLGIDPGGTTGIAMWRPENPEDFHSEEIQNGILGFSTWWESMAPIVDEVYLERFIISEHTARKSPQYDALYIIGHVLATCHLEGGRVTLQTPVKRKWADDKKLKAVGWHRPSPGGHRNDAARHLLVGVVDYHPFLKAQILARDPE